MYSRDNLNRIQAVIISTVSLELLTKKEEKNRERWQCACKFHFSCFCLNVEIYLHAYFNSRKFNAIWNQWCTCNVKIFNLISNTSLSLSWTRKQLILLKLDVKRRGRCVWNHPLYFGCIFYFPVNLMPSEDSGVHVKSRRKHLIDIRCFNSSPIFNEIGSNTWLKSKFT